MQDFYQSEFRYDPQPDNVIAVAKTSPFYTLTAIARFQANGFFETTERLPEVCSISNGTLFSADRFFMKAKPASPICTVTLLRLRISGLRHVPRSIHFTNLLYPNTYFGWLSVVPRVGFRGTYYDETRDLGQTLFTPDNNPFIPDYPARRL